MAEKRRREEIVDHLILLEHPPVYTIGRRDSSSDLLVTAEWIRRNGIEIHRTDRGGRVTYHGPGQLVGYLIFALEDSIPILVWKIEETLIRLLAHFHLKGEREPQYPGVWIGLKKIAAVGLRIERGVTRHGFSLNVSCDLKPYRHIHPCGITDRGVTSMEREQGECPSMRDVKCKLLEELAGVFKKSVSAGGFSPTQRE